MAEEIVASQRIAASDGENDQAEEHGAYAEREARRDHQANREREQYSENVHFLLAFLHLPERVMAAGAPQRKR
jgi:hypothetical protein